MNSKMIFAIFGLVIGFVSGVVTSAVVWQQFLRPEDRSFGRKHGYVEGTIDLIQWLDVKFNLKEPLSEPTYYDMKDARITVTETNGVRTLVVY